MYLATRHAKCVQSLNNGTRKTKNVNPISANLLEWSNTLKTICRQQPTNCLSVFGHFVGLALKGLLHCPFTVDLERNQGISIVVVNF